MACTRKNQASYGIITGGLGLPACKGMIVNQFKVGICDIQIIEPPDDIIGGGGGGSHPYAPGEFKDQFGVSKAGDGEPNANFFIKQREHVVIKIALGDNRIKKTYIVSKHTGSILLKSLKTVAYTRDKISTAASSVKNSKFINASVKSITTRMNTIKIKISNINNSED